MLYVVSCRHVVFGDPSRGIAPSPVVRLGPLSNDEIVEARVEEWYPHDLGDDVAALPLGLSFQLQRVRFIPDFFFVMRPGEWGHHEPVAPGDDAFFVGRFASHDGRRRNLPTVRFGNVSMLPEDPIAGYGGMPQESFLVEMRSLPGYSGSPVFVYSGELVLDINADDLEFSDVEHQPVSSISFLGVDWAHLFDRVPVRDNSGQSVEGWFVEQNSGMMAVLPAWKVRELLDREELVEMRKKEKEEIEKRPENVSPDALGQSLTRDDFLRDLRKATRRRDQEPETPPEEERS